MSDEKTGDDLEVILCRDCDSDLYYIESAQGKFIVHCANCDRSILVTEETRCKCPEGIHEAGGVDCACESCHSKE